MQPRIFSVALTLIILSAIFSQSFAANEQLRNTLENAWRANLQACKSGKEAELEKTLSSHQLGTIKNNLASARLFLTHEAIKNMFELNPDISSAKFVSLIENGPTAALVFVKDVEYKDANDRPRVEFIFIKFVKEVTVWKVDVINTFGTYKYANDGKETELDVSSLKAPFLIDGKIPKTPKVISMPDFTGYLEVDSYGYRTEVSINGIEQKTTINQWGTFIIVGGMNRGTNNIRIQISKIDKDTKFKPTVRVKKVLDDSETEESFSFEPKDKIEGLHTFKFAVEK